MHHYEYVSLLRSAVQRHQSAKMQILRQISKLIYHNIQFFIQVVRGHPGGRLQFSGGDLCCEKGKYLGLGVRQQLTCYKTI